MPSLPKVMTCSQLSVVCPHCAQMNHQLRQSKQGIYTCLDCRKLFILNIETTTTYITRSADEVEFHADDPDEVCEVCDHVCDHAGSNVKCCIDCTNHCNFKELP